MMDSQDNALEQKVTEEEQNLAQASEASTVNDNCPNAAETDVEVAADNQETAEAEKPTYANKQEVLQRIIEIAHADEVPSKEEVERLKGLFYRFHLAEREQQMNDYLQAGGEPESYQVAPDESETQFKAEMQLIKERRAAAQLEQEKEKEANLARKQEIIEKIKAMATSPDAANRAYNEFKALQQEWKEIRAVPAANANELWRNYQLYVEQFYDLLNLNREAREYDFKRNLELKTKLCETAEHLAEEDDVISAFHQLQELHAQYREVGPVAKELREEIWARFKAASTVINKRHQQHFEQLKAMEEENLAKKTALCEKAEALAKEENKGAGDWERHTKEMIALQQEWKTIGFAPQKMNVKIFERFRATCDDFFSRKAAFFKEAKERFAANAAKKRELVEKAKELAESTDWKATGDKLITLQKEWKTVGVVPKKLGDKLWEEFLGACNKFFEARNAATSGARQEQKSNLEKKRSIIAQLKELVENKVEDAQEKLHQLTDEYNAVGHVPFREKDKLYKEYHDVLDLLHKQLHISNTNRRLNNFRNNLQAVAKRGEEAVDNERGRLARRLEQLKQEIATYENNLGFLSVASKKGNSLVDEMNRKVQKLKDEADLLRKKITIIDKENKD